MSEKNKICLILANLLKQALEEINAKYNINMCLYQPGIEPLSIIGRDEDVIIMELRNNIIKIFSKFYKSKVISMRDYDCQQFFGLKYEELQKLVERVTILMPIVNCSMRDKEFSKIAFVKEANNYINKKLDEICCSMLSSYLTELRFLLLDFENYEISIKHIIEDDMISTMCISNSQRMSQCFRIFYKDNNICYCTIADALQDNITPCASKK